MSDNEMPMMQEKKSLMEYVDPAAVAAAETAKAMVQAAYIMAYRKPRDEDDSRIRILEACRRPAFAERVEYSKPVGNRAIKGPSIRFAETALRLWKNIHTETQLVYEDQDIRRLKVLCLDLETNVAFSKNLSIRKTVERKKGDDREIIGQRVNTKGELVYIVLATDDELHNKEAAMVSKAIRTEGLRLIPSDIVDDALQVARETLAGRDKQDPVAAKKKVLDAFALIGVRPKDIQTLLGHTVDTLSPAELQMLRGVYSAIKEGDATWADYVAPEKTPETSPEAQGKTLKEKLRGRPRKESEAPPPAAEASQVNGDVPKGITGDQMTMIFDLAGTANLAILEVIQPYGVTTVEKLTQADAATIIGNLQEMISQEKFNA